MSCLRWIARLLILDQPILAPLHVFLPIAIYNIFTTDHDSPSSEAWLFLTCLLATVPLAERLGFATDQLCSHVGQQRAGLLNASFGNVPELVVTIAAIRRGISTVAVEALIGSALSNLLLVSGLSALVGGLRHHVQKFNTHNSAMLAYMSLAMAALVGMVTAAELLSPTGSADPTYAPAAIVGGSRAIAVACVSLYGFFLIFSLVTHKELFDDTDEAEALVDGDTGGSGAGAVDGGTAGGGVKAGAAGGEAGGEAVQATEASNEPLLGAWGAVLMMAVLIALISWLSDGLVDAIDGAVEHSGIPSLILCTLVIPNVNNAPEHSVAAMMAWNNRFDAAVASSVGSAAQLNALLLPLTVLLDWAAGGAASFAVLPVLASGMAVGTLFATAVFTSGRSTWMHGVLLLVVYGAIIGAFWMQSSTNLIDFVGEGNSPPGAPASPHLASAHTSPAELRILGWASSPHARHHGSGSDSAEAVQQTQRTLLPA